MRHHATIMARRGHRREEEALAIAAEVVLGGTVVVSCLDARSAGQLFDRCAELVEAYGELGIGLDVVVARDRLEATRQATLQRLEDRQR